MDMSHSFTHCPEPIDAMALKYSYESRLQTEMGSGQIYDLYQAPQTLAPWPELIYT